MSRIPFIVGNWKMYKEAPSAVELCRQLRGLVHAAGDREIGVAPPFPLIPLAARALEGSRVRIGAQNLHVQREGAFTGEVSSEMLASVGCDFVIVGHSERRQYFQEADALLGEKTRAALRANLEPLLCVGESLEQRESGKTDAVIRGQLEGALACLTPQEASRIIVAYEPVWAIGTGRTATPEMAQQVHRLIRDILSQYCGVESSERMRILYGGSVKPDNVDGLMAQPDIDGALVGGASLKAEDFARIVNYRV